MTINIKYILGSSQYIKTLLHKIQVFWSVHEPRDQPEQVQPQAELLPEAGKYFEQSNSSLGYFGTYSINPFSHDAIFKILIPSLGGAHYLMSSSPGLSDPWSLISSQLCCQQKISAKYLL